MESISKSSPYPEAFFVQVKQVLENFYDFPFLNRHPLAGAVTVAKVRPSETDGQRLRRLFMTAIEEIKPSDSSAARSIQGRFYRLLELRYMESNTMQEVARELGVSERQAYRDLKRAEETLAAVLWARLGGEVGQVLDSAFAKTEPDASSGGLEEIAMQMRMVTAQELLQNTLRAVERLAEQKQASVMLHLDENQAGFFTDPRMAQQVLIGLASHILQNASTKSLHIGFKIEEESALFRMEFDHEPSQPFNNPGMPMINRLADLLGWKVSFQPAEANDRQAVTITTRANETLLLVIDDNNALIELLKRYLTNTRCQVIGASNGQEGLSLAQSIQPNAILLDVMMPDIDGWEILQRLKANPETQHIPVIVCSIFNDPGLAASLGAENILPKPVKRENLLDLLSGLRLV